MTNKRRRMLIVITVCVCMVYLVYRGLFTLNLENGFAATFSITLYLAEIYGNLLMFLYFFQIWNPTLPDPVPPLDHAKVDAYIPTYDEDPELLRGTIEGAIAMDYPHDTWVLDDGARPEVKALCDELGAKYLKRDSNIHAKAGNLNHAMEITDGDFIIVFDADHVAERHFITRTLGYFADQDLAFVQTPHAYYNFDSFQGSLDYDKQLYWEEGQQFYNIVQPGKNHWNSASFCGSAAIFRKQALEDVGLIATESITEDMQTGLRLHSRGWKSLYINERLVSGLAAPDMKTFTIQRLRWGEGNLGTMFYDNPFTMPGLSFAQRLNYAALMLSWTTGVQKLILYVTPLLMLLSGVGPVVDMTWHLIVITLVYVMTIWYTVKASGNGYGRLIDTEISQMASFWTQCRGTWRAIFNRKNATFVVTKKSGGKKAASGMHDFLRAQYSYIGASVVCITWAATRYFLGVSEDFLGLTVCSLLVGLHCVFAWIVIRRALAERRFDWRHPCAAHVTWEVQTGDGEVLIGEGLTKDLSEVGGAFIAYREFSGYQVKLTITAGDTSVTVNGKITSWNKLASVNSRREGNIHAYRYGVEFEAPTKEAKRRLWHMCTKFAVARRYHEFDPCQSEELMAPVTNEGDYQVLLPVRLFRPDVGDVFTLTESVANNAFTILCEESFANKELNRFTFTTCSGEITGNARVVKSQPIALGQMKLWAHRLQIDAFDGQSRGILTTLLHISDEPQMEQIVTLKPERTRLPVAYPAAIVSGIAAAAVAVTLAATLFLCQDEVLMARAILKKPIDEPGRKRLLELVEEYESNPTANERHFLRLRDAMQELGDRESVDRLNEQLVSNHFKRPAARLQQAYTLEKMGRLQEARDTFQLLLDHSAVFRDRATKVSLILAAARNAANLKEFQRAADLYGGVYEWAEFRAQIRPEYAGILTAAGHHQRAREVLTAAELTREDQFLLASIHTALEEFDQSRNIYVRLIAEDPTLDARQGKADVDAWLGDYATAIEEYRSLIADFPDAIAPRISLLQTLVWDKQFRAALEHGSTLLEQGDAVLQTLSVDEERNVWTSMLEAVANLEYVDSADARFTMDVFERRAAHETDPQFATTLARALNKAFEPDVSAPLVERLLETQPESDELHAVFARILYRMGNYNAAAEHYSELLSNPLRIKDGCERGELLLAAALNSSRRGATSEAAERYTSALACFLQQVQQHPQNVEIWLPFLNAVSGAKDHSKEAVAAVVEIYNSRDLAAGDSAMAMRLADALSRIQRDAMAVCVLDELSMEGNDTEFLWRRANILQRLGRHDEAESIYAKLLATDAFSTQSETRIALLLAAASNSDSLGDRETKSRRYGQCLEKLRVTLENAPETTSVWTPFLSALAGQGASSERDMRLVTEIYQRRVSMLDDTEFVERLTDVLLAGNRTELALPLLELLTERNPTSRQTRYRYACALQAVHQFAAAERQFNSLLDDRHRRRVAGATGVADDQTVSRDIELQDTESVASVSQETVSREAVLVGAAQSAAALHKVGLARSMSLRAAEKLRERIHRDVEETANWQLYLAAINGCDEPLITKRDRQNITEIYDLRDLHPPNGDFAAALSQAMAKIEQHQAATELLEEYSAQFPDHPQLRAMLARTLTAQEQHDRAEPHFAWLLAHSTATRDTIAHSRLLLEAAQNSRLRGLPEEAQSRATKAHILLTRALKEEPTRSELWQPYLDAAAASKETTPEARRIALKLFRRWQKHVDDLPFMERLADVMARLGYQRRALLILERIEARSTDAQFRAAVLLSEMGAYDQAEQRIQSTLSDKSQRNREDARYVDVLLLAARNANRSGDTTLSAARYEQALEQIRPRLQNRPRDRNLTAQFLAAVSGADSLTPNDFAQLDAIYRDKSTPRPTTLQIRLVDALLKCERTGDALPILQQLEQKQPTERRHALRLAHTLHSLARYGEAENRFKALLQADEFPDRATKLETLAAAARNSVQRHEYAEARSRFELLFELGAERQPYAIEYALVLQQLNDTAEAIAILEETPDLDFDVEQSLDKKLLYASMLVQTKDYNAARQIYEEVLQRDPQQLKARRGLAFAALWNRQYREAIERLNELLSLTPTDPEVHEAIASAHLWNGDYTAALVQFANLVKRSPDRPDFNLSYLQAASAVGSLTASQWATVETIEGKLPALASANATQAHANATQANANATRANNHEASTATQESLDKFREQLGDVYLAHGRADRAEPLFADIATRQPNRSELQAKHASALVATGETQRAITLLQNLVDAGTASDQVVLQLALGHLQADNAEQAEVLLDRLIVANAFADAKKRRAELLLLAASCSGRRGAMGEMAERYSSALPLWQDLIDEQPGDATLWPRFLDAAAGAKKLSEQTRRTVLQIHTHHAEHGFLTRDNSFMTRLIDVMIRIDEPQRVLAVSQDLYQRNSDDPHVRLRLANNLHAVGRFADADTHYDSLIEERHFANDTQTLGQVIATSARNNASMGNDEEARRLFESAWKLGAQIGDSDQRQAELRLAQFRAHVMLDEFAKARAAMDELATTKIDSGSVPTTAERALVLARTGDEAAALSLLEAIAAPDRDELALLASLYLDSEDMASAQRVYESLLKADPDNVEAQRWLADVHFWSRNYEEAIARYEALLARSPDDLALRESYAKSLLWIGRYRDAAPLFTELLKLQPDQTSLWSPTLDAMAGLQTVSIDDPIFRHIDQRHHALGEDGIEIAERLAKIWLGGDEPMIALQRLKPFMQLASVPVSTRLQYADTLATLNEFEQAIRIYRETIGSLPNSGEDSSGDASRGEGSSAIEYRLRFGDVLLRAKYYNDALAELDWVLERVDASTPARYRHALLSRARVLVGLRRLPEALQQFERLRELDPEAFDIHEEYSGALLSAGRPQEALKWLQRTRKLTLEGRFLLGGIYANLKQFREASDVYRQIIADHPNEVRAYRELADVSTWGKDYRTAIHVYRQLLRWQPDSESLHIRLGTAYLYGGRHPLALELFAKVLERNPERYDLWPMLVYAAAGKDVVASLRARELLETISASREHWPRDGNFRHSLMEALFRMERHAEGLKLLREIVAEDAHDKAMRRRLADELHRIGQFAEAENHYQLLLNGELRHAETKPASVKPAYSKPVHSKPVDLTPAQTEPLTVTRYTNSGAN